MEAKLAISRKRDPVNGRFVRTKIVRSSVVTNNSGEKFVDLVISIEGGPYLRLRMDIEGAQAIASDLNIHIVHAQHGMTVNETTEGK